MLFRNLFIATLAALALVGCNDDNDIDNPALTEAGDVNVVFATSSSEQAVTKSDGISTTVYGNFTSTDDVYEYCLKKKVDDPEFVIDHMTVFVFDEKGGLVKTAYFKDVLEKNKGTSMTLPDKVKDANSICEFGGIVLKAGTYNFILAGNLTKAQIKAQTETFEGYKNAAIAWGGDDGISSQITDTHLPMVKVLNKIKLIAQEKTANATLNLIMDNETESELEAAAPTSNTDESVLSVPSPIQLTRLVARIQLMSLSFNWSVKDNEGNIITETPPASIKLKNVYLANASDASLLSGVKEDAGYVHGFSVGEVSVFPQGTSDVENLKKASEYSEAIKNIYKEAGEQKIVKWTSEGAEVVQEVTDEDKKEVDKLPLSFYALARSINGTNDLKMVLECTPAYSGELDDAAEPVFYNVSITKSELNSIDANKVYNVNIRLVGQGSDDIDKEQEKSSVELGLNVGPWSDFIDIPINGDPTLVPNN